MNTRRAIILLTVIALAAGVYVAIGGAKRGSTRLAPAWLLTQPHGYRGLSTVDPFISWSPDSRSVLFSGYRYTSAGHKVFKWNMGEKTLAAIVQGSTPNFVSEDEFIYLSSDPKAIMVRSLSTGDEHEIMPKVKENPFWDQVVGIHFDPGQKTVALELAQWTRYYSAGAEKYDLEGELLGEVATRAGEGVLEESCSPDGGRCALLVQEDSVSPVELRIAGKDGVRGRALATGALGAVAWSPTDDIVVYGEGTDVVAIRPSDHKKVVVGKFPNLDEPDEKRYVARLRWSPNAKDLAVLVYAPSQDGDYVLIYVLDMSNFKWD